MVSRSRYVSADGLTIVVEVPEPPMGDGSGYIPPPVIEFWRSGASVAFAYQGRAEPEIRGRMYCQDPTHPVSGFFSERLRATLCSTCRGYFQMREKRRGGATNDVS